MAHDCLRTSLPVRKTGRAPFLFGADPHMDA
jgi:hypothetical protein